MWQTCDTDGCIVTDVPRLLIQSRRLTRECSLLARPVQALLRVKFSPKETERRRWTGPTAAVIPACKDKKVIVESWLYPPVQNLLAKNRFSRLLKIQVRCLLGTRHHQSSKTKLQGPPASSRSTTFLEIFSVCVCACVLGCIKFWDTLKFFWGALQSQCFNAMGASGLYICNWQMNRWKIIEEEIVDRLIKAFVTDRWTDKKF